MKILITYFSKTGYTKNFAEAIKSELTARGHEVEFETIIRTKNRSWIREVSYEILHYPALGLALANSWWRKQHHKKYHQIEEDIEPLTHPDISNFDIVCIGGPKWAHISYPVARYIKTVKGLSGKKVGAFATFGGPPFKVFELELISNAMKRSVASQGGEVISEAYISSNFHQVLGLIPIFGLFGHMILGKPIKDFVLGTEYANNEIEQFCDKLL